MCREVKYSKEQIKEMEEYNEWLDELAKSCKCCRRCSDVPCHRCQSGSPCEATCTCDEDDDYLEWE